MPSPPPSPTPPPLPPRALPLELSRLRQWARQLAVPPNQIQHFLSPSSSEPVRVPPHPPTSPHPKPRYICSGSGPCTPAGSPTEGRASVISCPRSSQPVSVPQSQEDCEGKTPVPSLDWDNYASSPEYSYKIPIVSTQYSDLESLSSRLFELSTIVSDHDSDQGSESVFDQAETEIMAELEKNRLELLELRQEILDEIDDNPAEQIKQGLEARAEKDLDNLLGLMKRFRIETRRFLGRCTDEGKDLAVVWEANLKEVVSKTLSHKEQVCLKISSMAQAPSINLGASGSEPDQYRSKCLELKQKKFALEMRKMEAQTKTKLQAFRDDYDSLMREIGEEREPPPSERSNQEISNGMQSLKRWERVITRMTSNFLAYDNFAELGDDEERPIARKEYDFVKKWYDEEKEGLEREDDVRGLFTNFSVAGEKLDYPKYGGTEGEDYEKFSERLEKAFKHNKVAKVDQLDKLRKCLSGKALALVPESTEGIEKALATLKAAFGDPEKILAHRLGKLKSFGNMPSEKKGSSNIFSDREEWFLKIESVIHDIIQLGKKDTDLAYEAFSKSTINFILALFPMGKMRELQRLEGSRGEKLENMLRKMGDFREEAREAAKVYGDKLPPLDFETSGKRTAGTGNVASLAGSGGNQPPVMTQVENRKRKVLDCRICKQLEADGYGERLFEDHLSAEVAGCPLFIKMNTEERNTVVFKARLCGRCLKVDVVCNGRNEFYEHRKSCKGPGSDYLCGGDRCKFHIWVCKLHAARNTDKMNAMAREMQDKGMTMGLMNTVVNTANASNITQLNTMDQAIRQLVNDGIKEPGCSWVNRPPEGSPMFMFARVKGKREGANLFFDKGCGTAVFRKGIPGKELDGVMLAKGKIPIGGVGGIEIFAEEDWLVSLKRNDGQRQLVQGLVVPKVTVDFPLIDLTKAVLDLKGNSQAPWIIDCRVPKQAGGVVDGLIGIQYSLIHPEPVHSLPNGLTLYSTKLAPHEQGFNATIGGPHTSFDFCCGAVGGAARVVTLFTQQLELFKTGNWSAPGLFTYPMSEEEIKFAKLMNQHDGGLDIDGLLELEEISDDIDLSFDDVLRLEDEDLQAAQRPYNEEQNGQERTIPSLTCNTCGLIATSDVWLEEIVHDGDGAETDPGDRIRRIKENWLQLESGLDIEYRCVGCRECAKCKNADQTEKISLREEAEMLKVAESVHLDWNKGKVVCSLPLRGAERDFLSTNKEQAVKVLDQQCRKWHRDEVNKEVILAAFEKLFRTGDTVFLDQIPEDVKAKFINKEVQYFIPWRIVFQDSVTTPVRPVLDGSSNTRTRPDGTGGRSLNDLVCKGKIKSLNLLRLLLRFTIGLHAVTGDLSQFYYSCLLIAEQWNLQRFVFRDDLDPEGELKEGVIGALIYGVKCVSAQTEHTMEQLAQVVEEDHKELAKFIRLCRYVDDLGESSHDNEFLKKIVQQADEIFGKIGLKCKGWTFEGEDPPENIMKAGSTLTIAGQRWIPKVGGLEVPIPELHFGVKRRGRIEDKVPRFEAGGSMADMEKFILTNCPRLTRRKIASKVAAIFDLLGKLSPVLAGLKSDLREVVRLTAGWDDPVSDEIRYKWIKNFWKMEQMRGIRFSRARMPSDAINTNMRIITVVDAALSIVMVGIWAGFMRSNGQWSCQHLIGRPMLAKEDSTIPKNELQGLTAGANLQWLVRQSLSDWISSSILAGDSEVALCWVTAENKPLAMFQRNRAIQVRRSMELKDIFHVKTECNPSDIGTRPDKVTVDDVGPGSRWEEGDPWMRLEIEEAIEMGTIRPALELRVKEEEESEFSKGIIFETVPEILTRGHVISESRVSKIEARANMSKYMVLPTKFNFVKVVRVTSFVMLFITKARKGRKILSGLLFEGRLWFSVFCAGTVDNSETSVSECQDEANLQSEREAIARGSIGMVVSESSGAGDNQNRSRKLLNHFTKDMLRDRKEAFIALQAGEIDAESGDRFINMALLYLYRKCSVEIKTFGNMKKIDKVAVEVEGVLLSKGRLLDSMNYIETGELVGLGLGDLGVRTHLPLIDRYSPMAYSVADHIHWKVARHRGVETCTRMSLENVSILQTHSIFREISEDCILCKKKRKKFLEVEMGPIADAQLTLAPPFWTCQVDLFGPITVVVPGFEKETRNRRVLEAKCWVMAVVCPATRLVNLQTLESCNAAGWLDAFTRLGCEVGYPSHVYCDQDKAGMSAFDIAETELRDLKLRLYKEKKIKFSVCAVTGHDRHGHVERVIRSVQESFNDCGLKKVIIHATGLQTFCKLVENQYNNLPLGYHYDRDSDNSPLLRILTPNMLRVGRVNKRAMDGPIRMPRSRLEILAKVNSTYDSWFKIWAETMVPKLLYKPKWFKTEEELKIGDLVYFPRAEGNLDNKWLMGVVDSLERGRDGLIRMVDVRYKNANQNNFQVTNRTIRKVVKVWGIEDIHLGEDLAEVAKRFQEAQNNLEEGEIDAAGSDAVLTQAEGSGEAESDDNEQSESTQQLEDNDVDRVGADDLLFQAEEDPNVQVEGDEPHRTHPGAEGGNSQVDVHGGGPAANTRSRKMCVKCCCQAHHSLSTHMRQCQLGEVPELVCMLKEASVLNLFSTEQAVEDIKTMKGDTIEEVLWAVGHDIVN